MIAMLYLNKQTNKHVLTWKVATIHMLKQEIIPSARAAVLRHGLTSLVSSPSFSTNLYRPYIVAIAGEKKKGQKVTPSQSPEHVNAAFIFLQKGKCDFIIFGKLCFFIFWGKNKTKQKKPPTVA